MVFCLLKLQRCNDAFQFLKVMYKLLACFLGHVCYYTRWVRKSWTLFHLSITFVNTVRILSLLQTEIICPQPCNWICHYTVYCCITVKNATTYCWINCWINSAMHAVISLLFKAGNSGNILLPVFSIRCCFTTS